MKPVKFHDQATFLAFTQSGKNKDKKKNSVMKLVIGGILVLMVSCVAVFFILKSLETVDNTTAIKFCGVVDYEEPGENIRITKTSESQAAMGVIFRLIGKRAATVSIIIDPSLSDHGKDRFLLQSNGDTISIAASTGATACWGFYQYLKKYCHCQISWAGDQLNLPSKWPITKDFEMKTTGRFRYYSNVCTFSYSFVWWNFTRWQREIDWMALNGINFPLSFTGQEAVWRHVYLKLGLSQAELDEHFVGPAFLAWGRMGNIMKWGGPLPLSWYNNQLKLQRQILGQMRSLGITPVLPGFAGHVPKGLQRLYPHSNITRLSRWLYWSDNYTRTYFLSPTDPLFKTIGKLFLAQMEQDFGGIDHYYNADTFNEMTPSSTDHAYLELIGQSIYAGMTEHDPKAVWVMQGWLFLNTAYWKKDRVRALVNSVPTGKMLVLDLGSDNSPQFSRFESFYGQPFIWNMLHDFGGNNRLYGAFNICNTEPIKAWSFPNSSMVGIGLTPEGINQNDIIYEFMLENAYRTQPVNVTQWVDDFALRRYGVRSKYAAQAWQWLRQSPYNGTGWPSGESTILTFPAVGKGRDIWFDEHYVYNAWTNMIQAAKLDKLNSTLFKYDLVDIGREAMMLLSESAYFDMDNHYVKRYFTGFTEEGAKFLGLLSDLDRLLATDSNFLLGKWIEDAKALGTTTAEKTLYEFNARNQVTLWGPGGEILDYARKQWSGLIGSYYRPRWELFYDALKADLVGTHRLNLTEVGQNIFHEIELPFGTDQTPFPSKPVGDPIGLSMHLFGKYRKLMRLPSMNVPRRNHKKWTWYPLEQMRRRMS